MFGVDDYLIYELLKKAFYEKKNLNPQMHVQQENNNATVADEADPELLAKVLAKSHVENEMSKMNLPETIPAVV